MTAPAENSVKLATAIYLKSPTNISTPALLSDFGRRWPAQTIDVPGEQQGATRLSVNGFRFTIESRNAAIPEGVTEEALPARHWPEAQDEIRTSLAHLFVYSMARREETLNVASALTKLVASLLSVSPSVGVLWLNGPVLNSASSFVGIATQMADLQSLPLILWIAAHWNAKEHLIYTKGMSQFGAPEILIAQQKELSSSVVAYVFDLADYLIASGKVLLDGETVDGPDGGALMVKNMRAKDNGRRGVFLVPLTPN